MKKASSKVAGEPFRGEDSRAVTALREVANAFVQLQEYRHTADYDNTKKWSRTETLAQIDLAEQLFQNWRTIKNEKIGQDYLLSRLIKERAGRPLNW